MSKPAFSRKRKGKSVDPYPIRGKGKSRSTSTSRSSRGRPRKPVGIGPPPMDEERFWSIVGQSHGLPKRLTRLLKDEPDQNLYIFQKIWRNKLDALIGAGVHEALQEHGAYGDGLDYATFAVIAMGRDNYEMALKDPSYSSPDEDGELFSYVALDVWEERHGEGSDFFEDGYDIWEEKDGVVPASPTYVDCSYCGKRHRTGSKIQRQHGALEGMTIDRRGPKRKAGEFKKDLHEVVQESDEPMTVTEIVRRASKKYPYRDPGGTGMYMWGVERLEDLVKEGKVGIYFGTSSRHMQKVRYGPPNNTRILSTPYYKRLVLVSDSGGYVVGRSPIPTEGGKPFYAWPKGATNEEGVVLGRGRSATEALDDLKGP